jgi:hypothetical protein
LKRRPGYFAVIGYCQLKLDFRLRNTGGKFTAPVVVDTGGKFATGVIDTGGAP